MESLFVRHRFLKQAKNRVSDWSLWCNAIVCWFPTAVTFPNRVWD